MNICIDMLQICVKLSSSLLLITSLNGNTLNMHINDHLCGYFGMCKIYTRLSSVY